MGLEIERRDRNQIDEALEPNTDAIIRIVDKVFKPMIESEQGSIYEAAKMLVKTETYGSTRDLIDELDVLDKWEITIREPGMVMKQDTKTTQYLLIQRFLESIVDREGWYTATWFKEQYGIDSARLRKAAQRGQLPKMGEQRKTVYSFENARRLWPEEITH